MLIITADDFGRTTVTTDNIVACFRERRLTSTSAMVFMQDSERAADLALELGVEVGLHLNFDTAFSGSVPTARCAGSQARVAAFLTRSKYHQLLFNPWLAGEFRYLYEAQYEAFNRLYRRPPAYINGHHHMHLASNVLLGGMMPHGARVRRSFTFARGERKAANRLYRPAIDRLVTKRFVTTDRFYAVAESPAALRRQAAIARDEHVELMVHVATAAELEYLMRPDFIEAINMAPLGTYRDLPDKSASVRHPASRGSALRERT